MAKIQPWSLEEFETLLEYPRLTDEELSKQLATRSVGAIRVVRSFIHVDRQR